MRECTPKVSVLMPAYNSEKYVGAAIESILNQTFADFEFIIINDGSTDGTPEIINKYARADKRIRFIDNKKNQGIIAAANAGLDLCRGEYIARMDSDDISLPGRLEKEVAYMDAHPECGVLGTSLAVFSEDNVETRIQKARVKYIDLLQACCIANPTVMLRTSVLRNNNILYRQQYIYAEDYGMWAELIKVTEIHNLQDVLLMYRWHDTNVSVVHSKQQIQSTQKIQQEMLSFLTDVPEIEKIVKKSARISKFYNKCNLCRHMKIHHPFRYLRLKRS